MFTRPLPCPPSSVTMTDLRNARPLRNVPLGWALPSCPAPLPGAHRLRLSSRSPSRLRFVYRLGIRLGIWVAGSAGSGGAGLVSVLGWGRSWGAGGVLVGGGG